MGRCNVVLSQLDTQLPGVWRREEIVDAQAAQSGIFLPSGFDNLVEGLNHWRRRGRVAMLMLLLLFLVLLLLLQDGAGDNSALDSTRLKNLRAG